MSLLKLKSFITEIYNVRLFYLISDWKTCIKIVKDEFNYELKDEEEGEGYTIPLEHKNGGAGVFIWIDKNHRDDVLIHEVFHAAKFILFNRGIGLTDSSEEAYAYFLTYLFNSIKLGKNDYKPRRKKKK